MFKNLLWRACLAFVLHCTPAIADQLSASLAVGHVFASEPASDTKST